MVGDVRPPRTYRISTATYLKYVTLVLHSTFYVRILIGQPYKAVIPLLTMAATSAPYETAHGPPSSSARPLIAAAGAWAPPTLRVR